MLILLILTACLLFIDEEVNMHGDEPGLKSRCNKFLPTINYTQHCIGVHNGLVGTAT